MKPHLRWRFHSPGLGWSCWTVNGQRMVIGRATDERRILWALELRDGRGLWSA